MPMIPATVTQHVRTMEPFLPGKTNQEEESRKTPYLMDILDGIDDSALRRIWNMGPPLQEKESEEKMPAEALV